MNKKIKISLLSVLLASSLAGVATTISSCSASAIPELTIKRNSNLITELDKVLTEYLAKFPRDVEKKQEFNSWISKSELPQSAKEVISKNIVFKNGSEVVPFDNVFEKFVVSNKSGFPASPSKPIPSIDIEIKIKESSFSIASGSTSSLKFTTGTLGKLSAIEITDIAYNTTSYEAFKAIIKTELNKAMDAAITYQDKFALYKQWTQGNNIPKGINDAVYNAIQFKDANNNIVTFNYVFDKFTIATIGEYPVGPNAPIPNMIVTPNIKPEYYIDPELLDKNLKFSDIPFTSNTGKIKLDVGFKDPKNPALVKQLSSDLSVATTYQERKKIFNDWNNTTGAMKPGSISIAAKNAIFSNLTLSTFGYNNPLTIDQFISKISIVPVNAATAFPNELITNLPTMKLVLTWNKDNFNILDGADELTIELPPLTVDSGVGEFDFTISKTLEENMTKLFTNELSGDGKRNKERYESWNSYNSLPQTVRNALAAGISFSSNIDIPNVNVYENIIDTGKTEIIKEAFPTISDVGNQIKPIKIKLVLKAGRFVKIGGSVASELPLITISDLPNSKPNIYTFNETNEFPKIGDFIKIIEESISSKATIEEKRSTYDSYVNFESLPADAQAIIDGLKINDVSGGFQLDLKPALESKIIYKGPFPSVAGETIPPITLELNLNKGSTILQGGNYYKTLPIVIIFNGITS